jgi:CubicO group peptidase (beta-lactamase class C family)
MRVCPSPGLVFLELLFLLLLSSAMVHAEGKVPNGRAAAASLDGVEAILRDAVRNGQVGGASLILVHHGEVVFKRAVGNLSVDQRVRIASSSKPVAAAAILTLVDDGILALNDPVSKFLPEFEKTKVASATLGQLLSHTSGMPRSYPGGRPQAGSLADFSRRIASRGSLGAPGSFQYSGVSIDIACRMAEAASGVPFEALIQQRLWGPLGMTHTIFSLAADLRTSSHEALVQGEGRYVSCGGGMSSTLDDMAAFYQMLLDQGLYRGRRILSAESLREMVRKHSINPRKVEDPFTTGEYGLALYRDRVGPAGTPLTISHGGVLGTMPWADLDRDLVGVFLSDGRLKRVLPVISRVQQEVRELIPPGASAPDLGEGNGRRFSRHAEPQIQHELPEPDGSTARRDPRAVFMRMSEGRSSVDREEFRAFVASQPIMERLQGRPEVVDRIFRRLDGNDDGRLTLDEYEKIRDLRLQERLR